MKRPVATIAALAAGVALIVGLSAALAATHTTGRSTTVSVARSTLGSILVDRSGRTLYLFTRDKGGHSACYGSCAGFWPPLIVSGKPSAGGGAKTSLVATIRRRDGRLQATYRNHPLYRFVNDKGKGQTNGEELNVFGGKWYVLSPGGTKVEKDDAPSVGQPATGGYGY